MAFVIDYGKTKTATHKNIRIQNLHIITSLPPQIAIFLASMIPLIELRGSIPLGFVFGLAPETIYLLTVIGSLIPAFFILLLLDPVSKFLIKHFDIFDRFFKKLFKHTREKHGDSIAKYGPIFLIVFVAIPLPGSGAWTGSLIAFLFNIKYWKAISLIALGLAISGLIMIGISMGGMKLFHLI